MDDNELTKIAEFFLKHSKYKIDLETVKKYILKHYDYHTAFVGYDDDKEITFICRWNINGDKVDLLDFYIREDWRGIQSLKLFRQLLKRGIWLFPYIKYVGWKRGIRTNDRGIRYYSIDRILKGERL